MNDLDVRSRPRRPDRTTQRQLADFETYVHWVWPGLPAPMTLEWSDSPVVALNQGRHWIYSPVERDPLQGSRGGTVLPSRVRARLKKITTFGVPFQRLAIGHVLDRDGPVCDLSLIHI